MIDRETRDRLRADAWQTIRDWIGGKNTPAGVLSEAIRAINELGDAAMLEAIQLLDAMEEPDAPVLVWESDDGDETLLHAESKSYAGKLGAKWLLVQLASGDWAIYPPTELDHYSVRILKLVPTLEAAKDLAERLERELRK